MEQINLIERQEKRHVRLAHYFAPYRHLVPSIGPAEHALRVIPTKRGKTRRYGVEIYHKLLDSDVPDWLEPLAVEYARRFVHLYERTGDVPDEFAVDLDNYDELQNIFRDKREAEIAAATPDDEELGSLENLWRRLRVEYFPENAEIDDYEVTWAARNQRSSLASCNIERKRVEVAKAMDATECYPYLEALLYHEMCHAIIGEPKRIKGRTQWHGKEFKELERRHPGIAELDSWIKRGGWDAAVKSSLCEHN